jgi:hypothetical protein
MGRIGQAVAKRALAFGMRVVYTSRTPKPLPYPFLPLEELLAQADIVSLHAPLTPETHRLLNRERLFAMKPGAILLNTARGGLVDTEALVEALDGHLFGAGLDVTDPEPLPPEHPLYARKNAVITPHLGSAGRRTRERMAMMAVENLLAVLKGLEPPEPGSIGPMSLLVGFLGGLFGGLVGLGGGTVMIPLMVGLLKLSQHKAHGTSLVAVFFTGLMGAFTYGLQGSLDLKAGLLLAITAILTARYGARYAHSLPEARLRRAFGWFLFFVSFSSSSSPTWPPWVWCGVRWSRASPSSWRGPLPASSRG